tara:strand:+ start:1575 stop:2177 length:603 start_codon:yes stop_codon:yes gene_type:complete
MELNKLKIQKKNYIKILLTLLGILIIFLTYFSNLKKDKVVENIKIEKKDQKQDTEQALNTFEDVKYEGVDSNNNKFVINSEYAEFTPEESNIIYMKKIICRFYLDDGTVLKITSDKGIYNNINNDMEFENNVKMFYLKNKLSAEKANYVNSESYLLVQENVIGETPNGNLVADKLDFDLIQKNLKISMYNENKVNIKVNY